MTPFAAAIPQPVHSLAGGRLATGIRDALTASSFRHHMAGDVSQLKTEPAPKARRKHRSKAQAAHQTMLASDQVVTPGPPPTIAQQAARAIRLDRLEVWERRKQSGRGKGDQVMTREKGALLDDVRLLVDQVMRREGWRHVLDGSNMPI